MQSNITVYPNDTMHVGLEGPMWWRDPIYQGRTYWRVLSHTDHQGGSAVFDDFGNLVPVQRRWDYPVDPAMHQYIQESGGVYGI